MPGSALLLSSKPLKGLLVKNLIPVIRLKIIFLYSLLNNSLQRYVHVPKKYGRR